jgi:SagB-type dehydrogenase family enzyme
LAAGLGFDHREVLTLLPAARASADTAGSPRTLPEPTVQGGMALTEALARRRSVRRYTRQPLSLAAVSQLLWAAQGRTGPGGQRTAPSAGALYPLELHLVALRVEGLAPGAYRYRVPLHALQAEPTPATAAPAAAPDLQQAAGGQAAVGAAAAVVVFTAVETRSAGKYGTRAARYAAFEAGAAAQNLALQATALGLGSVVIGGLDEATLARALGLPPGEWPLVLVPVGVPG